MTDVRAPARELERNSTTHLTVQRAMLWMGPLMMLIFVVAFVFLSRLIPPPSPMMSPAEVVARMAHHLISFRAGLQIAMISSGLLMPFYAVISAQLRRIEGYNGPLSQTQLVSGGLLIIEFIIPFMLWMAAAYRVDAGGDPQVISGFNDLAWMMMIGVSTTVIVQIAVVGVAILIDKRENPIFPRWSGYFNFWVSASMVPGGMCEFFKTGPFAWNGLLACWYPFAVFSIWMGVMVWLVLRAIDHQAAEEAARL